MTHSTSHPYSPPYSHPYNDAVIRVAADSPPAAVAGAIAKQIRQRRNAQTQAIGVTAVNQMLKATIIASKYLSEDDQRIVMLPSFIEVEVNGRTLTAIHLLIQPCQPSETSPCPFFRIPRSDTR